MTDMAPVVNDGLGGGYPLIMGYCPTCGFHSLFLALGGYITCAIRLCPDPMAAHKLLNPEGAADDAGV